MGVGPHTPPRGIFFTARRVVRPALRAGKEMQHRSRGAPSRPSSAHDQPNKQTAGRDLRQTPLTVGPAAITITRAVARMSGAKSGEAVPLDRPSPGFAVLNPGYKKGKRNAERRCPTTAVPPPSSSPACGGGHRRGHGTRPSGRARLSAFHHGTCGSDRTPPLSSSHATSWNVFGAPAPMVRKTERIATHDAKPTAGFHASLAGITRALLSQSSEIAPAVRS